MRRSLTSVVDAPEATGEALRSALQAVAAGATMYPEGAARGVPRPRMRRRGATTHIQEGLKMARKPAVAGQFYPAEANELRSLIADCMPAVEDGQKALGALMPHAGYVFSGRTAGEVVARIEIPAAVIILNPSHHAYTPACALWTGGAWRTPLGEVELHEDICRGLARLPMVTAADGPHLHEHSGEVVVPFIQYRRADVRIADICITSSATIEQLKGLGEGIRDVLASCGEEDALVIASSDMSHEDAPGALNVVNQHDPIAIAEMEQLDPDGLVRVCRSEGITMCGVLPAVAMMASVRARGGSEGVLVHRATSADSPYGRGSYVVGYAGMIFR